jgi:predicted MFS family arabinose efflux permease
MGTCLCAAAYLIQPLMDRTTPFVLTGLFLVFFSFELTFVTTMSLATELVPSLRASTMSAFYAISGIGRVAGALTGGLIWTSQGISGISLVSGTCTLAALGCLAAGFRWQKERETTTDPGPQDR